jgi:acyl-CoA synthetase (AMP-forming)/AMP-acid ligase II
MTSRGLVSRQNLSDVALFVDGGLALSYGMLHTEIKRFADKIPQGQLVFLIGSNDQASVTFYLACLEKGAVPLLLAKDIALGPLQKLMHAYKPNYLFKVVNGGTAEDGYSITWQEGRYGLFQSDAPLPHVIHPDLALLLATSGSTGSVKLVRLSLRNIIANAMSISQYLNITPKEIAITSLPLNYSYGLSIVNSH